MSVSVTDDGFDNMLNHAILVCDKEAQKMMDNIGNIVLRYARKLTKVQVDEMTGNYLKNWKSDKSKFSGRGNLYKLWGNKSPHAHLIENGHRNIDKNGVEHGFTPGFQVLKHAQEEAQNDIDRELELFVETVMGGK